uniref:Uncharacterized protein n=1 Tax=Cacopsylla melanoneura TaxID=428564 RepID=A0A8D8T7Q1_9HEMI
MYNFLFCFVLLYCFVSLYFSFFFSHLSCCSRLAFIFICFLYNFLLSLFFLLSLPSYSLRHSQLVLLLLSSSLLLFLFPIRHIHYLNCFNCSFYFILLFPLRLP